MSDTAFSKIVGELLRFLGIGDELAADEEELLLNIDGSDVLFRSSEDGRSLVVEVFAGLLDINSGSRRDRLEKLLKINFALSAWHNATATLDGTAQGVELCVKIKGGYRYNHNDVQFLADVVSDVVFCADTLSGILAGPEVEKEHPAAVKRSESEFVLFTP